MTSIYGSDLLLTMLRQTNSTTMNQAADEIERLREAVEHLRREVSGRPSNEMHDAAIAELTRERDELRAQVESRTIELKLADDEIQALRAALTDAIESVESWSAYADPYYLKKHDLAGDLARLRAAL